MTACALAFALHLIGHPGAAVYDGSWSEWGLPGDTPVETGPAAGPEPMLLHDTITYLEMLARPTGRAPAPLGKLALMRAENCTVSFYRYLYDTVGEPWLWFERRLFGDAALGCADRQADDRDLRALCRRRAGRLFRARRRGAARDQAVLFRAGPRFHRPRVRRLYVAGGDRPGLDRATDRPLVAAHLDLRSPEGACASTSAPGFVVYARRPVSFEDPRLHGILPRTLRHRLLPPLD